MDEFAAAVLDAPADDAPRLVWADWLDEHGHAEAARLLRTVVGRRPWYSENPLPRWSWHGADRPEHPAALPWPVSDLLGLSPSSYDTEAEAHMALARGLIGRAYHLAHVPRPVFA